MRPQEFRGRDGESPGFVLLIVVILLNSSPTAPYETMHLSMVVGERGWIDGLAGGTEGGGGI